MKRLLRILILTVSLLFPLFAYGTDLYVHSIKAPLLAEPLIGAKEIASLKRADVLNLIEKKGDWYKVRYGDLTGWVLRLFVDTRPPMARVSILEKQEQEVQSTARRRASAFVTAAAARGLMEERARLSDRYRVDHEGVEWIKSVSITDEEALRFLEEGLKR